MTNALHQGSNYSQSQALQDFALGFIGDLAGGGIGELVNKYGAAGVAKGISKIFGEKRLSEGIRYVWDMVDATKIVGAKTTRGEIFEHLLAGTKYKGFEHLERRSSNFPYVDFYRNGTGISLKTTKATSGFGDIYKNIDNLFDKAKGKTIRGVQINDVELHIGVPEGYDQTLLNEVTEYAIGRGVNRINIFEIK